MLAGIEAGLFEPPSGKLEPWHERRFVTMARWLQTLRKGSIALRLLNGDASFGELGWWFKIGVSHDRLSR